MKKILFNERYGLRSAVINGCKNMTRRNANALNHPNVCDISEWGIDKKGKAMLVITYDTGLQEVVYPHFQIGEIVAISQPYESFMSHHEISGRGLLTSAGTHNSMFVKADLMPYRIRITDIKAERLQDISDVDAIKEGIYDANDFMNLGAYTYFGSTNTYKTPHEAFAALIDRISGKGTWERNPWVFAYEFELIK